MLKWITNRKYKQKTNNKILSWTDVVFLCIYTSLAIIINLICIFVWFEGFWRSGAKGKAVLP